MTIADLIAGYARYATAADLSACRGAEDSGGARITTSAEGTTMLAWTGSYGLSLGYWPGVDSEAGSSGEVA